jgi:hypothetical protein
MAWLGLVKFPFMCLLSLSIFCVLYLKKNKVRCLDSKIKYNLTEIIDIKFQLVVTSLLSSLKPIGNTVLICCAFFLIFSILGVQLLAGKLYHCEGPDLANVTTKMDCLANPSNKWINSFQNYDNIINSLFTLFIISTRVRSSSLVFFFAYKFCPKMTQIDQRTAGLSLCTRALTQLVSTCSRSRTTTSTWLCFT